MARKNLKDNRVGSSLLNGIERKKKETVGWGEGE